MTTEPRSRSRSTRRRSRLRVVLWVFVLALVASLVAGGLVLLARPQVAVAQDSAALARISVPGLEGRVASASVESMDGRALATSLRKGKLWPMGRVQVNRRLLVHVTVRRPGWAGWLLGKSATKTFVVRTPAAQLEQRWLLTPTNGPVTVSFAAPVRTVRIGRGSHVRTLRFASPRSSVVVGRVVPGLPRAGSVTISAVPRMWERLPRRVRVSWFPVGNGVQALAEPALGKPLHAEEPITITFAKPVRQVLGERLPTVTPGVPGRWRTPDTHTITFRPARFGYPLGGRVVVHMPTGCASQRRGCGRSGRRLERAPRLDPAPAAAARAGSLPAGRLAARGRRRPAYGSFRSRSGDRPACRAVQLALREHAPRAASALAAGRVERDHARRGDAVRAHARARRRRVRRPEGLARAARRHRRGQAVRERLQLRLRPSQRAAVAQPLARRARRPHLARQHRASRPPPPSSGPSPSSSTSPSGR